MPFSANKEENVNIVKIHKDKLSLSLTFKLDKGADIIEHDFNYFLLRAYLCSGTGSLLYRALREKGLIYNMRSDMRSDLARSKDETLFSIDIYSSLEKFNEIIDTLNEVINKVKHEHISQSQLQDLKNNFIYSASETQPQNIILEMQNSLAFQYERFEKIYDDPSIKDLKKLLKKVTPETLNKTANEIFSMNTPLYITIITNADEKFCPTHIELKKKILKD